MANCKLAIDPGHGMSNRKAGVYDPGACAGGCSEADIALQWALTLKWVAEQKGIDVFLTRDDDRDPTPVGSRNDLAEAHGCTHFLSIHCNAGGGTGCETYYRDRSDLSWAVEVQGSVLKATGLKDRGLKVESKSQHSHLAVLDFKGPACLVEIGFIDSTVDRARMLDRNVRMAFANNVLEAILG